MLSAIDHAGTTHGYEIVQRLSAAGLGEIKGGTLYPVLARLEEQGLISSRWVGGVGGPGRKLVEITGVGRSERTDRTRGWQRWISKVNALVGVPVPRA